MNTFFEKTFADAKSQWLESITNVFDVNNELFTGIEKKHKFYRMPYFSGRRYFTMNGEDPHLMTGLTALSKKIVNSRDEDKFLEKWKIGMVQDGNDPDEFAYIASEFGTLVHIVAANIFSARSKGEPFYTQGMEKELMNYMTTIGISAYYFKEWHRNLCAAIRSLNNFYTESEMKVLGVEYCVADFENNICTPLDIICEINSTEYVEVPMKTKEGTKKEKRQTRDVWNLNIKARSNTDRRSNDKYQICAEQYIANKYFEDFDISTRIAKTGVLSPSWNWKVKENAGCKLHDFTDAFPQDYWNRYLKQFREEPGGFNTDLFRPNLDQFIGDSNVFSINEKGDVYDPPQATIREYILSRFKVK